MQNVATKPWFTTATGKRVFLTDPDNSEVCIEDIAMSLARLCRWGGHLRSEVEHYSVAQHSVMVSFLCAQEHALLGLLHDAAEAYVMDAISPLKGFLGEPYRTLELHWALRIGRAFGIDRALVWLPDDVKHADRVALETERRDLVAGLAHHAFVVAAEPAATTIVPLSANLARAAFLRRFEALT
jgi:hypothetical protein